MKDKRYEETVKKEADELARKLSHKPTTKSKHLFSVKVNNGGHHIEGQRRSEGKREAWVTKPKKNKKECDTMTKHSLKRSNDLGLSLKTNDSPAIMTSVTRLDSNIGNSKQLKVSLTRLSRNALIQHGCPVDIPAFSSHNSGNFKINNKVSKCGDSTGGNKTKVDNSRTSNSNNHHHKTKSRCFLDSNIVTKEFKRKRTFSDSTEFSARIHSYSSNKSSGISEASSSKRRRRRELAARILNRHTQQKSTGLSSSDNENDASRGNCNTK